MSAASGLLPSPCIGVCHLDSTTGWCVGCGRNADELTGWGQLPVDVQARTWALLPQRLHRLGRATRVLPWSGPALLDRLTDLARLPGCVWQVGTAGASASIATGARDELEVASIGGGLVVRSPGAGLWLRPVAGLRAFVRTEGNEAEITLALHGARLQRRLPDVVTDLGIDEEALAPDERGWRLFDLGLALPAATRFCVRTGDAARLRSLERLGGRALPATFVVDDLPAADATSVLLSPLGRLEVAGPASRTAGAVARVHLGPDRHRTSAADSVPGDYVACARITTMGTSLEAAGLEITAPATLA